MPDAAWWRALWPDPAGTLRRIGIGPALAVLDLCCGDGWFTAPLCARGSGSVVAPHPFDYVLLANTFHGVPDPRRLALAVAAVLRDGGRLGIIGWYPRPREETCVLGQPRGPRTELRQGPEAVASSVEGAGFTLESVTDVSPFHYAAVFVARSALPAAASGASVPPSIRARPAAATTRPRTRGRSR